MLKAFMDSQKRPSLLLNAASKMQNLFLYHFMHEINKEYESKCGLLCISISFYEGADILTTQRLQAIEDLFDFASVNIADIRHEIRNL
jgi:hypothetical protein